MKHTFLLRTMACCMAGSLLVGTAFARQDANSDPNAGGAGNYSAGQPPAPSGSTLSPMSTSRSMHSERLSQLMGSTVKDQQGNTIGQINDFVVNPTSGRIQFAVISLNDQAGKLTAVPWQLVRPGADPTTSTIAVSKQKLDSAQTFDASSWPNFNQPQTDQQIYSHFGIQPPGHMGYGHQGGVGTSGGYQGGSSSGQGWPNQQQGNPGNQ